MFMIVRSPKWALLSLAVSLGIFLILYFTVIQPDNNTANNAIKQGEQQVQQAVDQAGGVPAGVSNLANCLVAAGADTGKIQACQAKFKP
jgi:hypothetical protein